MLPCCIVLCYLLWCFFIFLSTCILLDGFQHWLPSYNRIPAHMQQHIFLFFNFKLKNEDWPPAFSSFTRNIVRRLLHNNFVCIGFDFVCIILRSFEYEFKDVNTLRTKKIQLLPLFTCVFLIDLTKKSRSSRKSQTNNKI